MPGVLLDGYYGEGNAGDDAFCLLGTRLLAPRFGSVRVLAAPELLPAGVPASAAVLPSRPRVGGEVRARAVWSRLRCRTVVHLGGSTLRRLNRRRRDELAVARTGLVARHAVGVSVGPFRTSSDAADIRRFLAGFASISTRDSASAARLAELDLDVPTFHGFDVAALLPGELGVRRVPVDAGGPAVVGVSLRSFEADEGLDPADEARRDAAVVEALRDVARARPLTARLLVLNRHPRKGDLPVARRVAEGLATAGVDAEVVPYDGDLTALLDAVARCHAVVAMRLHAAVFARALGVPVAIVSYHPKCDELAADIGLPEELVWPRTGPGGAHAAALAGLLEPAAAVVPGSSDEEARARGCFDHLFAHL